MNRFKELRKQHHFTQQDVSNALKGQQGIYISPDSLEKYESGEENPKIDEERTNIFWLWNEVNKFVDEIGEKNE